MLRIGKQKVRFCSFLCLFSIIFYFIKFKFK
ncbi:hypothetical protein Zm00014a_019243 [Zea mays]|uniref:Uncharacterized protein n=1 Tax=Zea mays TaxID=4577 RepID=A0A3L6EBI4_MAIZE|nr:hypothetical protein Zm00014a_019243 [Zea mays]